MALYHIDVSIGASASLLNTTGERVGGGGGGCCAGRSGVGDGGVVRSGGAGRSADGDARPSGVGEGWPWRRGVGEAGAMRAWNEFTFSRDFVCAEWSDVGEKAMFE